MLGTTSIEDAYRRPSTSPLISTNSINSTQSFSIDPFPMLFLCEDYPESIVDIQIPRKDFPALCRASKLGASLEDEKEL